MRKRGYLNIDNHDEDVSEDALTLRRLLRTINCVHMQNITNS